MDRWADERRGSLVQPRRSGTAGSSPPVAAARPGVRCGPTPPGGRATRTSPSRSWPRSHRASAASRSAIVDLPAPVQPVTTTSHGPVAHGPDVSPTPGGYAAARLRSRRCRPPTDATTCDAPSRSACSSPSRRRAASNDADTGAASDTTRSDDAETVTADAEDRAYYILPPGNYGGLPTNDELTRPARALRRPDPAARRRHRRRHRRALPAEDFETDRRDDHGRTPVATAPPSMYDGFGVAHITASHGRTWRSAPAG